MHGGTSDVNSDAVVWWWLSAMVHHRLLVEWQSGSCSVKADGCWWWSLVTPWWWHLVQVAVFGLQPRMIARFTLRWGARNGSMRLAVKLGQQTYGGCCGGGVGWAVPVAQGSGKEREQSEGVFMVYNSFLMYKYSSKYWTATSPATSPVHHAPFLI